MTTPPLKQEVEKLAREHFRIDPTLTHVHWFGPADSTEVVRLIEVNNETFCHGKVLVFSFRAIPPEVPFKLQIADVHPDDWDGIEKGLVKLPEGWPEKPVHTFSRVV